MKYFNLIISSELNISDSHHYFENAASECYQSGHNVLFCFLLK